MSRYFLPKQVYDMKIIDISIEIISNIQSENYWFV